MKSDFDDRVRNALKTISESAVTNRDSMRARVLRGGAPPMEGRNVRRLRPVTAVAAVLVLAAGAGAAIVATSDSQPSTLDAGGAGAVPEPDASTTSTMAVSLPAPSIGQGVSEGTTTTVLVAGEQLHLVVSGEDVDVLAREYCVTVDEIIGLNQWDDGAAHVPAIGEQVRMPASKCANETQSPPSDTIATSGAIPTTDSPADTAMTSLRFVAPDGQTTTDLADRLCVSPPALASANGWAEADRSLVAGDSVNVPSGACIRGTGWDPATGAVAASAPVSVIGETEAGRIAASLQSLSIDASAHAETSSGLARPELFDWPAALDDGLDVGPPGSAVVVVLGSNDAQALTYSDGSAPPIAVSSPEWLPEYQRRVRDLALTLSDDGHVVIWVGAHAHDATVPPLQFDGVDGATQAALQSIPGTLYISAQDVLRFSGGTSGAVVESEGSVVPMFDADRGVLSDPAIALIAERVQAALSIHR